jgi:hypothetical protein
MNPRPFDWRDLPALHRYRNESVFLDSALLLTRGALLVPGVLFSYLAPSLGVFTSVLDGEKQGEPHLMGQFIHMAGTSLSHLTFLAPQEALESTMVCALVEHMMTLSGERGAMRLLADVDERSLAFEALRQCGFAIYNRQRIWRLASRKSEEPRTYKWRKASDMDVIPVRNLYNNLVPGLVQQIEPFSPQRPRGMVHYENGDLLAYVELKYGHRGIWAQPFIHPDVEDVSSRLSDLLSKIWAHRTQPIYFCVRSYQSWLEAAIEELGAEVGPRQAVMVRQLVVQQKAVRPFALPALEGGQAEITAPIVRMEN